MVKKKVLSFNNWRSWKRVLFDRDITIIYAHKIQIGNKVIATKRLPSERKRQYNWWGAVVLQNIP